MYDRLGVQVREVEFVYDGYGRLTRQKDNGRWTTYRYRSDDPYLVESVKQTVSNDTGELEVTTTIAGYDPLGRAQGWSMSDSQSSIQTHQGYTFDRYGRVDRIETELGEVSASYEAIVGGEYGALNALSYNLDGAAGAEVTQALTRYGVRDGRHNRRLQSRGYYFEGRVPAIGRTADMRRELSYTDLGQIRSVAGARDGSVQSYSYDGMGYLKQARSSLGRTLLGGEAYDYDSKGNRRSVSEIMAGGGVGAALQRSGYADGNRIDSYQTQVVGNDGKPATQGCEKLAKTSHDGLGRLLIDPSSCKDGKATQYEWDAEGHLAKVIYGEGSYTELKYDGQGSLIRRIEVEGHTPREDVSYVWQGGTLKQIRDTQSLRLIQSFNGDGYKTYEYDAYGQLTGTESYLMLKDHQGSVIGIADQQGKLREELGYDP